MATATRRCTDCKKTLPLASFPNNGQGQIRWQCSPCFSKRRSAVRRKNPDVDARVGPKTAVQHEELGAVEEHRLKTRVRELEGQMKTLIGDLANERHVSDIRRAAMQHKITPIRPRERTGGKLREATALAVASDWHVEEEVRPEQVEDRNRFNLAIAERRIARFFEATRYAIDFNRQIFKIRDLLMPFLGDFLTNYLREEDVESNLLSPPRAIAFDRAHMSAGIRYLLKDPELELIRIPCMSGNHGRLIGKEKIKHRTREQNSLEWMLYAWLAEEFKNEPRVQFQIAESELMYTEVYGRSVRTLHGDLVRYAGGVGGVTIPIYKAVARWDTKHRADLTIMGHWHQLLQFPDLIVNGSLIGHSPYSDTIGARFEPPAQAFTILDPLRFKSVSMPLWVASREDDVMTRDETLRSK